MKISDHAYLRHLDQDIFSLQPNHRDATKQLDALQLISIALRLLNISEKRLENHHGDVLDCLEYNNIYYHRVALPEDLKHGEFPLLLIFDTENKRPFLLHRDGHRNCLVTIFNGRPTFIKNQVWPTFTPICYELHRSFRDRITGIIEVIRLAYQPEINAITMLLVIALIVLGFSLSIPILTNTLVSTVLPQSDFAYLFESLVVVALIVVASITSQYLQEIIILRLETVGNQRLQIGMWEHFLKLPTSFTTKRSRGNIYVALNAIARIRQYVGAGTLKTALSALFSFAFLALMFSYSPSLAIWMILLVAAVLLVAFQIAKKAIQVNDKVFALKGRLNCMSYELSGNATAIRALGAEVPMLKRWMERYTEMANASLQLNTFQQSIDVILNALSPLGSVLLFAAAVMQILNNTDEVGITRLAGSFIAFYSAFMAFSSSITNAATNLTDILATVSVLWRKAGVILDAEIEPGWQGDVSNHRFEGEISFSDVIVQPSGLRQPLLEKITLDIPSGTTVAITGKKASGKSLVLKTILGMTTPNSGNVLVDGLPINKISARGLRRQIGYIPQDVILENISLRDLLTENRKINDDQIWNLLSELDLDKRIHNLPQQLDTTLRSGGAPLSRNERKRIALARALLRQPAALLMDELLAEMPEPLHGDLCKRIHRENCTIVLVASLWREVQQADCVVLLDEGRIIRCGKPGEPGLDQTSLDLP